MDGFSECQKPIQMGKCCYCILKCCNNIPNGWGIVASISQKCNKTNGLQVDNR